MCGAAGGLKRHLILSYFTKLVLQKLFKLNIFELVFDNLFISLMKLQNQDKIESF